MGVTMGTGAGSLISCKGYSLVVFAVHYCWSTDDGVPLPYCHGERIKPDLGFPFLKCGAGHAELNCTT